MGRVNATTIFEIIRPDSKAEGGAELAPENQIPSEREKLIDKRSGFDYMVILYYHYFYYFN